MPIESDDKSYHISGIPSTDSFSQLEDPGAEPNRDERGRLMHDSNDAQPYAHDYFDDEEERLDKIAGRETYARNESWAPDGVTDEANEMAEADWSGAPYRDEDVPPDSDVAWMEKGEESMDLHQRAVDIQPGDERGN